MEIGDRTPRRGLPHRRPGAGCRRCRRRSPRSRGGRASRGRSLRAGGRGSARAISGPTSVNAASPAARWAATGEKMSRPWNVCVVVGSHRSRFVSSRAAVAPPSASAAAGRSPLSGPMRTSPRSARIAIGAPGRADAGIDDGDMDPDRHERQRGAQHEGAVADRELPDAVGNVDDLRVAADAQDHPLAGRGRAVESEVGEEADDRRAGVSHPRMLRLRRGRRPRGGSRRAPPCPSSDRTRAAKASAASGSPCTMKTVLGWPPRCAAAEVGEPGLELVLVGVGAEAGDRAHAAADRALLAVDARRRRALGDVAPERSLALVADEQERAGRIGEEVLEVVHDPAAGQHAGRGDDHDRAVGQANRLRLLDRVGELLARVAQRRVARSAAARSSRSS